MQILLGQRDSIISSDMLQFLCAFFSRNIGTFPILAAFDEFLFILNDRLDGFEVEKEKTYS